MFLPRANAATISLVPQSPAVFVNDPISIDVMLYSDEPISKGALDFSYPPDLVDFVLFSMNPDIIDGSSTFFPNSSTPGILDDFIFTTKSGSGPMAARLATMLFDAGSSPGTADFGVFLETVCVVGSAWVWGLTGDAREGQPISAADLAEFAFNGTSVQIQAIPIPPTIMLLGGGLMGLVVLRRHSGLLRWIKGLKLAGPFLKNA